MPVYFDNNATTAMAESVLESMLPYLQQTIGNPSSVHRYGRMSRQAIDTARQQVADLVNVEASQVVFTSGGTEANNLAIQGSCRQLIKSSLSIAATEHPSVIEPAQWQEKNGWLLKMLTTNKLGLLDDAALQELSLMQAGLTSVMLANNETGVIQNLTRIAEISQQTKSWLHTDASQAAAKIPVDFKQLGVQLMTLSSHKMYGPRGAGALIIDKSIEIKPLILGGGQERDLRSGTENIAAIVGFGQAAVLAKTALIDRHQQLLTMKNKLESGLKKIDSVTIFAEQAERLPNTTLFAVAGIEGETLLMQLDKKGFAVSSGSACHSSKVEASHVLQAMGVSDQLGSAAIRVSLGSQNTLAEVDLFIAALQNILEALRPNLSSSVN